MSENANPDIQSYTDLDLVEDLNEDELRTRVIEDIQVSLPEWNPREGSIEVILAGALSLVVSEYAMAVADIPDQLLERLLALYQVHRNDGIQARSTAVFTVSSTDLIHTIPAGTALYVAIPETDEVVEFTTDEELQIVTSDSLEGVVPITAVDPGDSGKGIPVGSVLELTEVFSFVESVRLGAPIAGGTNPETDEEYYTRGSTIFQRMSTTLVVPEHFKFAVLENADVGRATVINLHDPDHPEVTNSLGHITIAVADQDGEALPSSRRQELYADLILYAQAGLTIHVVDPTYTDVAVAAEIQVIPGYDEQDVIDAVTTELERWISPKYWEWSKYLYATDLIVRIGAVEGVRRVVEVTVPNGSTELTGVAPLPRLTDVNITVV